MCTHRYFCWVACVCNCKVKKCWKVSRVCVGQELPVGCTIVGDPQHDIINLSKVLHFRAADKEDLQKDHIDMTHRLSAADSPVSASKEVVPEAALSDAGLALLRSACIDTSPAWHEQFESSADAAKEVKGFLALPSIQDCKLLQVVEVNFWGVPTQRDIGKDRSKIRRCFASHIPAIWLALTESFHARGQAHSPLVPKREKDYAAKLELAKTRFCTGVCQRIENCVDEEGRLAFCKVS